MGTTYNTPVLKDGLLFGLSDRGNLFCLRAGTGEALWTDEAKLSDFGAILDAGPVMLVLPTNSELIAFKPDGARFERVARFKVAETPTYATPIVAGNRVFVKDQETVAMFAIE